MLKFKFNRSRSNLLIFLQLKYILILGMIFEWNEFVFSFHSKILHHFVTRLSVWYCNNFKSETNYQTHDFEHLLHKPGRRNASGRAENHKKIHTQISARKCFELSNFLIFARSPGQKCYPWKPKWKLAEGFWPGHHKHTHTYIYKI